MWAIPALIFFSALASGAAASNGDRTTEHVLNPDCTDAGIGLAIRGELQGTNNEADAGHEGDTIDYKVTVFLRAVDCPITDGTVVLTLPNTSPVTLTTTLSLASGASTTFDVTGSPYTINNGDIGNNGGPPGAVRALASLTATSHRASGIDQQVGANANFDTLIADPAVAVTKTADTQISKVGDTINYSIEVCNTGNIPLNRVSVIDTLLGDISGGFPSNIAASTCAAPVVEPYTVQPGDPNSLENRVTVTYRDIISDAHSTVTDDAEARVTLVHPDIRVEKDADTPISKVGDEVHYTITVTNTGDVTLENITVDDSLMGDLSASFADTLAPGASETHTFPRTVQPGDPNPLINTVTVHSNPAGLQNDVSNTDSATVDLVDPAIDVEKSADTAISKVGDEVHYTITVTNTGDVTLENITVGDSLMGDLSASFADTLAPGASETHTFPRTVQPGDPNPLDNTVTVHANPQGLRNDISDQDTARVDLVHPDIAVTKTSDTPISKVGDTVHYIISISNTGDVNLVNITVTDSLLGDLSASFADILAPGASESHTFPRTVLLSDLNPLINRVAVHANPEGLSNDISDEAQVEVDLVTPIIDVEKSVDTALAVMGQTVHYTITVTNTGDVNLVNITVGDSVIGDLSGSFLDALAPGASEAHTFAHTVTPSDPDPLVNTVTVHANPQGLPNDVTDQDSARVDIVTPQIDVEKEADTPISKVGDQIHYTITISNTGDIVLENITVGDSLMGNLSGSFADTLAPGASETHTFIHTVSPSDPNPLVNTVTARANPQESATDVGDIDSATVNLVHPAIDVTKTASPTSAEVGEVIDYNITIRNTGDITLVNITVSDSLLGDLSASFANSLAPGASESHDFPRTILSTDPNPLINAVTVHANPQGLPNDISDTASAGVEIVRGGEGCTPGFWKNHPEFWGATGFRTTQTLESVFDLPDSLGLDNFSLLQALSFRGGNGVIGGAKVLLRAGVGALLNAGHPFVDFPRSQAQVIAQVNAALASGDRSTMLALASSLDVDNNLGCPLCRCLQLNSSFLKFNLSRLGVPQACKQAALRATQQTRVWSE